MPAGSTPGRKHLDIKGRRAFGTGNYGGRRSAVGFWEPVGSFKKSPLDMVKAWQSQTDVLGKWLLAASDHRAAFREPSLLFVFSCFVQDPFWSFSRPLTQTCCKHQGRRTE